MKKRKESARGFMGFGIISLAPVFLFFPYYASIDVLPDFIGWIIVLLALRRMRDVNVTLGDAALKFRTLLISSFCRFLSVLLLFGFIPTDDRPTAMLIFAFTFGLVDILFGIPAWNSLFGGLTLLEGADGGHVMTESKFVERTRKFTLFFLVARNVLAVVPEMAVLSSHTYDDTAFAWYKYLELFRGSGMFLSLVFGLIWAVSAVICFVKIGRDDELFEGAKKKYTQYIVEKPGVGIMRRTGLILITGVAAAFLAADLHIENVNIIPDFLCAATLAAGFLQAKAYSPKWKAGVIASGLFAVFSVLGWIGSNRFHNNYTDIEVSVSPDAYSAFMKYFPLEVCSGLLFGASFLIFYACIADIIRSHCGYLSGNVSPEYSQSRLAAIRHELFIRLNISACLTVITAAASAVYPYFVSGTTVLAKPFGTIVFFLSVLNACILIGTSMAVKTEVDSRYMLD